MYKAKFGRNLTLIMTVRGITPLQLAETLKVSRTMVYKYMKGKNLPIGEDLCNMADEFKMSIDALVGRKPLILAEVEDLEPPPKPGKKKKK